MNILVTMQEPMIDDLKQMHLQYQGTVVEAGNTFTFSGSVPMDFSTADDVLNMRVREHAEEQANVVVEAALLGLAQTEAEEAERKARRRKDHRIKMLGGFTGR